MTQPSTDSRIAMPTLSTNGTKGAAAELIVAVDLMRRGLHVFRALSPACPWDLVVETSGGQLIRLEVKSAVRERGKLYFSTAKRNRYDVICCVTQDDEIIYSPPIDEW